MNNPFEDTYSRQAEKTCPSGDKVMASFCDSNIKNIYFKVYNRCEEHEAKYLWTHAGGQEEYLDYDSLVGWLEKCHVVRYRSCEYHCSRGALKRPAIVEREAITKKRNQHINDFYKQQSIEVINMTRKLLTTILEDKTPSSKAQLNNIQFALKNNEHLNFLIGGCKSKTPIKVTKRINNV